MADVVKTCLRELSDLRALAVRGAGPLRRVVGSTIGVLWESAGLVCNVAELGLSLVLDTRKTAPGKIAARNPAPGNAAPKRAPAPGASNVIPFPSARNIRRQTASRG